MEFNQYFGLRDDISNCVQNQILICKCLYVFHHLKLSHRYILFDIFFTFIVQNWAWSNFLKFFSLIKITPEWKIPKPKKFWSRDQSQAELQILLPSIVPTFQSTILPSGHCSFLRMIMVTLISRWEVIDKYLAQCPSPSMLGVATLECQKIRKYLWIANQRKAHLLDLW